MACTWYYDVHFTIRPANLAALDNFLEARWMTSLRMRMLPQEEVFLCSICEAFVNRIPVQIAVWRSHDELASSTLSLHFRRRVD